MNWNGKIKLSIILSIFLLQYHIYAQDTAVKNIDGLKMWFVGDSVEKTDNKISKLIDISGNQYHAQQLTESYKPLFIENAISEFPVIRFDGSNDQLILDSTINFFQGSIFIIARKNTQGGSLVILGKNSQNYVYLINNYSDGDTYVNLGGSYVSWNTGHLDNYTLLSSIYSGTEIDLKINKDTYESLSYTSSNTLDRVGVSSPNNYCNGDIAEIIYFDDVLTESEMDTVHDYLRNKYAPPLDLTNGLDISYGFNDTTISAYQNYYTAYNWSTGSTDSAITVNKTGKYYVTVTDIFGFESFDSIAVTFPVPNQITDTTICLYDTITWDPGLTGDYTYEWKNGETTPTLEIFSQDSLWLIITDDKDNKWYSDTITVTIDSFPVENSFAKDTLSICKGESVTLDSQGPDIQDWLWSTGSTDSYILVNTEDNYSVTVTNTRGCQGIDTTRYEISGEAPTVLYEADTVCLKDSTTFTNLSTIGLGSIDSVLWNFGDGQESILSSPRHYFSTTDTLVVRLTAYSGECSSFYQDSVFVKPTPEAGFYIENGTNHCTGKELSFIDTSTSQYPIVEYFWTFGDTGTSTDVNPKHSYGSEGTFTTQQNITNNLGCLDNITLNINISDELPLPLSVNLLNPLSESVLVIGVSDSLFNWEHTNTVYPYLFELSGKDDFSSITHQEYTTDSSLYFAISDTGSYYWRIWAYNVCGDSVQSSTGSFSAINLQNGNLSLWLDALEGVTLEDTSISQWTDLIENFTLTQTTQSNQPEYIENAIGEYPVARFDGINDQLSMNSSLSISKGTFFAVAKKNEQSQSLVFFGDDATNYRYFINNYSDGYTYVNLETSVAWETGHLMEYTLISCLYDSTNIELFINGTSYGSLPYTFDNSFDVFGLSNPNNYCNGDIAEVIFYDSVLTESEMDNVHDYLRNKYAPPLDLTNGLDISYGFNDTTISAYQNYYTAYNWSTGSTDSAITVNKTGKYYVTVTDIFGFESFDSIAVTFPVPNQITDTTICLYDTITWDPGLTGDYTYEWKNGETTPTLEIFSQDSLWLIITDDKDNKWYSDTITVTIDSFPVENSFAKDTLSICKGESVTLDSQGPDIQDWLWSTGSTDSYILVNTEDNYSVTVTNTRGCQGIDTTRYEISGEAPTVLYEADTVCLKDSTTFTNLSTIGLGSIDSVLWNFGDGQESILSSPRHYFSTTDTLVVRLTAYSGECSSFYQDSVFVKPTPEAGFYIENGNQHCTGKELSLVDTSVIQYPIVEYYWTFGDTQFSTDANPTHTYVSEGTFSPHLKITNSLGCLDSISSDVDISDELPLPLPVSLLNPLSESVLVIGVSDSLFNWEHTNTVYPYLFELSGKDDFSSITHQEYTTDSSLYFAISDTGSYYWRIWAYNVCGDSVQSSTGSFSAINLQNGNLSLWLDALEGVTLEDTSISQWADQIENFTLTQGTQSSQPEYIENAIGEYPVARFDGINDQLSMNSSLSISKGTFFAVAKKNEQSQSLVFFGDDATNYRYFINNYSDGYTYVNLETSVAWETGHLMEYTLISCLYDSTNIELFINGTSYGSLPYTFDNSFDVFGLSNPNNYCNGDIAEVIFYDSVLTESEMDNVHDYLRNKYAPPLDLTNGLDISYGFNDTTISAYQNYYTAYNWSTGSTDSAITVNKTGKYYVTVTDIFGFESEDSIAVTFPVPNQITDTTICLYDTITWDPGLTGDYTYEWKNGETTPTLEIFSQDSLWLIITDDKDNKWYSDTITVTIDSFPVENSFAKDTLSICKGESVTLDSQGPDIQDWLWSTGSTDSYILVNTEDNYSVTVTNTRGCQGIDTTRYEISGEAPTVLYEADTVCLKDSTTFTNLSTIGLGSIDSVLWNFGDGQESILSSPRHYFSTTDTLVVRLTAYSGECSSFYQDSVFVKPTPEAGFYIENGTNHCTGKELSFIDTSTSQYPIVEYYWTFGDTGTSTDVNPKHSYGSEGTFTTQQNITNNLGCLDNITLNINISDELPLPLSVNLLNPLSESVLVIGVSDSLFNWEHTNTVYPYLFELSGKDDFSSITHQEYTTDSSLYFAISDTGSYYWRIWAYNVCGDSVQSSTGSFSAINLQNGNLSLWLDALEGVTLEDTSISQWTDLIENFTLTQTTQSNQPEYIENAIGEYPVARFDGINDQLSMNSSLSISKGTFFAVAKKNEQSQSLVFFGDDATNYRYFINNYSDGYTYVNLETSVAWETGHLMEYTLISCLYDSTNIELFINGTSYGSLPYTFDNSFDVFGLSNPNNYCNGDIAEVIFYDSVLTESEMDNVHDYLRNKYAPPLDLTNGLDISYGFNDTTISAYQNYYTAYNWSTGSTDSAITVNKTGKYYVTVTDIFGFESSDSITVSYPTPNQLSDTTICLYDTITWDPGLVGDYTYEWSHPEFSGQASATITQTGSYSLVIRDNKGNPWYSDTISVIVNQFPVEVSLGNDKTLCSGNRLYLFEGHEEATSYIWSTGSTDEFILIEETGEYSVSVANELGCIGIDTVNLTINGIAPNPDFEASNFCFTDNVKFNDLSDSPDGSTINYWDWSFGDGDESNVQNPEHLYSEPGIYDIVLEIGNDNNCNNEIRKQIQIYHLPKVDFQPNSICSNQEVEYSDLSTSIDGIINDWHWIFPEGIESTVENPLHTIEEPGFETVKLIVTTSLNCKDSISKEIEVKQGPDTDFIFSAGCEGQPVYFTDNSESFLNFPLIYSWNFNGLGSSTINNPSFSFPGLGNYEVTLTTKQTSNNCSSSATKTVNILQKPIADFSADKFCVGNNGTIVDNSIATESDIVSWRYTIDTIGLKTGSSIEIKFNDPGEYGINQMIEDANGCRDTMKSTITVNPLPVAGFETNLEKGPIPLTVNINNLTEGAEIFNWMFGDGETSTEVNPSHVYTDSGIYIIDLIAENEFGCLDSISRQVKGIVALINMSILAVEAEVVDGYLEVSAILQNLGTLDLTGIEVFFTASNGQTIKEEINATILSGKSIDYKFSTKMQINSEIELTHVCVRVNVSGLNEEYLEDNEKCFAFESAFKDIKPYPNPADDKLIIEYIIPYKANVSIVLFNSFGERTNILFDGESESGFNQHIFDVSTFGTGIYFYRIEFEGNKRTYQIMIK